MAKMSSVPKVRVELTRGHPYRSLSLVRIVLISAISGGLVRSPKNRPVDVRDKISCCMD